MLNKIKLFVKLACETNVYNDQCLLEIYNLITVVEEYGYQCTFDVYDDRLNLLFEGFDILCYLSHNVLFVGENNLDSEHRGDATCENIECMLLRFGMLCKKS